MTVGATTTRVPVTAPSPWLMLRVGVPETVQVRAVDWPATMVADVGLKLAMTGLPVAEAKKARPECGRNARRKASAVGITFLSAPHWRTYGFSPIRIKGRDLRFTAETLRGGGERREKL